jgi:hypothetical protein
MEEVRELVSKSIEEFRAQLEADIREKVGSEYAVDLQVSFQLLFRPVFQVSTMLSIDSTMEVGGVDVDQVPTYRWKPNEPVHTTAEPVSLAAIAAAIQRRGTEEHVCSILRAFAQNGNAPLSWDELKKLGVPDSFYEITRQSLRYAGVPFTIEAIRDSPSLYRLSSIMPPRSFKK